MQRLSGLDASFLYLETPSMPLNVGFVVRFRPDDMPGGYDYHKIVALLSRETSAEPAYRRRLVQVPFHLNHPLWLDDPAFDVLHHVRHVALPAPGDDAALGELMGRIIAVPLDRARPLWEAWIIEGLQGGSAAFFFKYHHAAGDGVAGSGLLQRVLSPERLEVKSTLERHRKTGESIPNDLEVLYHALGSRLRHPLTLTRLLRKTGRSVRDLLWGPDASSLPHTAPLDAPRTFFNARIGPRREAAFVSLALPEIQRIRRTTGTRVNDVVLALVGGALRRYLLGKHALPDRPLTAMIPVSVRLPEDEGGINNRVAGMWSTLATHLENPLDRLAAINESMKGAKRDLHAVGADLLRNWAEFAPPRSLNLAVRFYATLDFASRVNPVHNVIVSNVPGPRHPLFLAGATVEAIHAIGPVMEDMGLNFSMVSYRDRIGMVILVDPDLLPDVQVLAACFEPATQELLEAAERLP